MGLTAKEEIQLIKLLEAEQAEKAKKDFKKFSREYLWITDKQGDKIKLIQNNVQNKVHAKIQDMIDRGKPPRLIILKSRQMGISTDVAGYMTYKTTTQSNRNGLIVAHRDDSTSVLFNKGKYFYDNLEEVVKPLQQASNAKELIFSRPTHYKGKREGLNSKIRVQTAGTAGIGRSDTYHYVHLSEYGFWTGSDENSPSKQLTGILQSVPDNLDTFVIIESTANGLNDFKEEWDKAVNGESAFEGLFLAWFEHEEYIKPVNDAKHFIDSMNEYERWLYYDLNLPVERVAWWRWALINKCNGDINQMKQENPTTAEEAFIHTGTPVFDNETVLRRIEELKNQSYKEGYFDFQWHNEEYKDIILPKSIKFVESQQKPYWRIYDDVMKDVPYVIAGDTKGEGKDEYTAQVMDNTTGKRVATCQIQLNNSKPYTWQMYCAGLYYNKALIGIEMNFNTAPLEELQRLKYPKQYWRERPEGFQGETQQGKIGWKTDGITRPRMIDKEIYVVNEHISLIQDVPTLRQMLTFIYDKNGRPDAMSGKHDDLLIADCILNEISDQQTSVKAKKERKQYDDLTRYAEEINSWSIY